MFRNSPNNCRPNIKYRLRSGGRSTEELSAHQVSHVSADSQQCTQANQVTNDPDVQQYSWDRSDKIHPEHTPQQRVLAEQDGDTGRTAKQASIEEMRGLQTVTLTG